MALAGRFRLVLALERKKPVQFLTRCNSIYTGISTHASTFPVPSPALPVVLGRIQTATSAHQLVTTRVRGAAVVRAADFAVLNTSIEMWGMMVQALCDAAPAEQAASIAALASMQGYSIPVPHKDLLAAKSITPTGWAKLVANAGLLDSSTRQKTYNWGYTLDAGKTVLPMPSTPVAHTTIGNLTPLTMVGFTVSVTVNKQPPGAWSPFVYLLIR